MILFFLVAATQWQIDDIVADDTRSLQRVYERCVVSKSKRFARSRDRAEVVVFSAMTKCKAQKRAYFEALNGDSIETNGKPFGFKFLSAMERRLDEKVRRDALLAVTEVRSAN